MATGQPSAEGRRRSAHGLRTVPMATRDLDHVGDRDHRGRGDRLDKDAIAYARGGGSRGGLGRPHRPRDRQGAIFALIALGYTLVYGILRMINFAHGEVFMAGAFISMFFARRLRR